MKKLILLLLILFPFNAYAQHDMFAVEEPSGTIHIINYYGGEPLENIINKLGFNGYPIQRITKEDMPNLDKTDRDSWAFNDVPIGKKIKIDPIRKAEKDAEKAAKDAERDAVLLKLKITKEEFEKLK